jgi:hypothetical protein
MAGNSQDLPLVRLQIPLLFQETARQVVGLPTGVDHDDRAAGLQSLTGARGVPLPGVLHRSLRQSVLFVQDVVQDDNITAAPGHRTALTNEKGFTALGRVPPTSSLGVHGQGHAGEELFVLLVVHEVSDHATEALSEVRGVRADDELGVRLSAQDRPDLY